MDLHKYALRDARDAIIDLLPLKGSLPIPNLPVRTERPIVNFKDFTYIVVEYSQPEVFYEVYDDTNTKVNERVRGNGGELHIKTGELTREDYTFSIVATKAISGLTKQLLQTVTVKVGVDTGANVSLKDAVVDFNGKATVIVDNAQSNAKYQVFALNDTALSNPVDSGRGGPISIETFPVKEDTAIKIRATNIKTGLSDVLTKQLTILVNPDTSLVPKLKDPVADYNGKATIVLDNSQATASYQIRFENIDDDDPAKMLPLNTKIGKPVKGTGKAINIPTDALSEDLTVNILATKVSSGLEKQLQSNRVIPVKPDTARQLSVVEQNVKVGEGATVKVSNSQRGIIYQLRLDKGNKNVGNPVYHHKNYGIGRGRMEIEFVVDRYEYDYVNLPTGPLQQTTTFNVLAIKATTKEQSVLGPITVEVK